MNSYNIEESKKVQITVNWLGHEGLRYVQTITDNEQKSTNQAQGYLRYYVGSSNLSIMRLY